MAQYNKFGVKENNCKNKQNQIRKLTNNLEEKHNPIFKSSRIPRRVIKSKPFLNNIKTFNISHTKELHKIPSSSATYTVSPAESFLLKNNLK